MESEKKHRSVLRGLFTKKANEIGNLLLEDNPDAIKIKTGLQMLQAKLDELVIVDSKVYEKLLSIPDTTEEDLCTEMENSDKYKQLMLDLQARWEAEDDKRSSLSASTQITEIDKGKQRKFRLPTIEIKKFSGNIRDWLPFWAQFKKINDDPDIDLADKIIYLNQATVTGSTARQIVDSFPAVPENYEKIINCLKSRFGREDLQIEVYVRELLKIVLNKSLVTEEYNISSLYDKIETQLRCLETLGITSDKYAAMLYPLIESCLPESLIRVYQRSHLNSTSLVPNAEVSDNLGFDTLDARLKNMMQFLRAEVQNEQRILLAAEGFGLKKGSDLSDQVCKKEKTRSEKSATPIATASGLVNCDIAKCIFCEGNHDCKDCFKAQKMTFDQKRARLSKTNSCFRCLKTGHSSRRCNSKLRCLLCGKGHVALMCPELPSHKAAEHVSDKKESPSQTLANYTSTQVFLQTLRVKVVGRQTEKFVRVLIDTGSQRSYILKSTVQKMGFKPIRVEKIKHTLFGGKNTNEQHHNCYTIKLSNGDYNCSLEVLDQPLICSPVPHVSQGSWLNELSERNIEIGDVIDDSPIEILLGADVIGKLYTGRKYELSCGLVAMETFLGWTLIGKMSIDTHDCSHVMSVFSLFVQNARISELWELDVLGILDPTEKKTKEERSRNALHFFENTIRVDEQGRYVVKLPWIEDCIGLSNNLAVAKRRLESAVNKLKSLNILERCDLVFQEWINEEIIEEVTEPDNSKLVHYLPHRPVIKESSLTTKIRPVFDASSHERGSPSLNQCLEVGPNLLELIPTVVLRFRQNKLGVVSDIRKAFLQIAVDEEDRNFLRFLWIDAEGNTKIFRHRRVVFGVSSSPFLLGATINYHLSKCRERCSNTSPYSIDSIDKLSASFYVDNCVTSVSDEIALHQFIREASQIMDEAKMDLRGWEYSQNDCLNDRVVAVLGLSWNIKADFLTVNKETLEAYRKVDKETVTKRSILSAAQKLFDPIGFTCPVSLLPKLLLQQLWSEKKGWDEPLVDDVKESFITWVQEIDALGQIEIPRWIYAGENDATDLSLHTFCDASKKAYSAVVFLRAVCDEQVLIFLVAAKSRVAPLKNLTIPRLELLGATISARLYNSVKDHFPYVKPFFWSDSSTVISWIRRPEEWATFVKNRVKEIRSLTEVSNWYHIAGTLNPADLPSRGCTAKYLLRSRWWEGPSWLYQDPVKWNSENFVTDEEQINAEKRKTAIHLLNFSCSSWHLSYFSRYSKTVRMIAWIKRFCFNLKNSSNKMLNDNLTAEEISEAEIFVLKVIQQESFEPNDSRLSSLRPFIDKNGLIRLRTQISQRSDTEDFRFPIVLPGDNFTVRILINDIHRDSCHVGIQGLLSILREKYWVLGSRRTLRSVLSKCGICKRHSAKPYRVESPPLPLDRVRDAVAFQITGVDYAGPLYLKTGQKAWICLFTCAVYRAVHLELVTSLSTRAFVQAFRRFTARRGRPDTMYSDNGSNFVGFDNACQELDWKNIMDYSSIQRIKWRFNPPTAAWWGGFWERLIGILKGLLRKILGRASLDYEDMLTLLCECENVVNARPLTYVSNDPRELIPLTPAMFLREQAVASLPDCDMIDRTSLCRKAKYLQRIMEDLRKRFRTEYLAQLKPSFVNRSSKYVVAPGDIVLVGNDREKRLDWSLGRVTEVFPGRDNQIRLVKVETSRGEFLRPVQRLYPLEIRPDEDKREVGCESSGVEKSRVSAKMCESLEEPAEIHASDVHRLPVERQTRSGRTIKLPVRFMSYET